MTRPPFLGLLFTPLLLAACAAGVKPAAPVPAAAPRATTLKLTVTEGSGSSDEVRCGLQDRTGNLWFGTTGDGVYRFDGEFFTHYTVDDGLSSKTVWSILEDSQGRIWFGTDAGLCRWHGEHIERVPVSHALGVPVPGAAPPNQAPRKEPAVWSMLHDSKGTIWLGTAEGMLCYKDGALSNFLASEKVQNPGGLHLKMVDCILEDTQGNTWFASGMPPGMEGLCRFDGVTLTSYRPGGQAWIRSVKQDAQGVLWLGTRSQGVWRFDGTTFSRASEESQLGMPLLVDRSGQVWFGGSADDNAGTLGIWRYDGRSFQNYFKPAEFAAFGAGTLGVWSMVEDRSGNIWVGTRNTGLYRFDGTTFTCFSQ